MVYKCANLILKIKICLVPVDTLLLSFPRRSRGLFSSQNVSLRDTEVNNIDGDGVVMTDSKSVNIDAGPYDE